MQDTSENTELCHSWCSECDKTNYFPHISQFTQECLSGVCEHFVVKTCKRTDCKHPAFYSYTYFVNKFCRKCTNMRQMELQVVHSLKKELNMLNLDETYVSTQINVRTEQLKTLSEQLTTIMEKKCELVDDLATMKQGMKTLDGD